MFTQYPLVFSIYCIHSKYLFIDHQVNFSLSVCVCLCRCMCVKSKRYKTMFLYNTYLYTQNYTQTGYQRSGIEGYFLFIVFLFNLNLVFIVCMCYFVEKISLNSILRCNLYALKFTSLSCQFHAFLVYLPSCPPIHTI